MYLFFYFYLFILKFYFIIFREMGREGEKHQLVAFHTQPNQDLAWNLGMFPDQNLTGDILLCGTTPNQLSHTGQGLPFILKKPLGKCLWSFWG